MLGKPELNRNMKPVLRKATEQLIEETWRLNHKEWAQGLSMDQYIERERTLASRPLTRDGALTSWILTPSEDSDDILCACETIAKPMLISINGVFEGGKGFGIASVFCREEYRKKGYASEMLKQLASKLKEEGIASALYSDIGETFYEQFGWKTFPSRHVALSPTPKWTPSKTELAILGEADMKEICELDCDMIMDELSEYKGKAITFLPTWKMIDWHHSRARFIYALKATDSLTKFGARASDKSFIIWNYDFSGSRLFVLRLRYESLDIMKELLAAALSVAVEYKLSKVSIWDVKEEIKLEGVSVQVEEMRKDSISALQVYGFATSEFVWPHNEKFAWC